MSAALIARALEDWRSRLGLPLMAVERRPIAVVIEGSSGEVSYTAAESFVGPDAAKASELTRAALAPADVGNPIAAILSHRLTSSGVYQEDGQEIARLVWTGDADMGRRA